MKIESLRVNPRASLRKLMLIWFTPVLFVFGFAVIAQAKDVSIDNARASDLQGNYTIYAYGCESSSEAPSFAILKKEGAAYDFNVETAPNTFFWSALPETEYQVVSNVPATTALAQAESFVKCNPDVQDVELNRITGPDGAILGYEMLPVYSPLRYGSGGMLAANYRIEENEVVASVGVDPMTRLNEWGGG